MLPQLARIVEFNSAYWTLANFGGLSDPATNSWPFSGRNRPTGVRTATDIQY